MRPWCLHRARMMLCVKVNFACLINAVSAAMAKHHGMYRVLFPNVWKRFERSNAMLSDLPLLWYAVPLNQNQDLPRARASPTTAAMCQALQGVFPICACPFLIGPLRLASGMGELPRVGSISQRLKQDAAYMRVLFMWHNSDVRLETQQAGFPELLQTRS